MRRLLRLMRNVALVIVVALAVLSGVLLFNVLTLTSRQIQAAEGAVKKCEGDVAQAKETYKQAKMASDDKQLQLKHRESKLLDVQGFNGASTVQLASATTSNLGAYRAYLDGVKLLNSWRLAEADREFAKAIHLDTTFALAYHKRALGLGWGKRDWIEQDPDYDSLRDDPRFVAMLSRLK